MAMTPASARRRGVGTSTVSILATLVLLCSWFDRRPPDPPDELQLADGVAVLVGHARPAGQPLLLDARLRVVRPRCLGTQDSRGHQEIIVWPRGTRVENDDAHRIVVDGNTFEPGDAILVRARRISADELPFTRTVSLQCVAAAYIVVDDLT